MKHYKIETPLAKGYSGHVYLATNTETHKKVAIKVIPVSGKTEIQELRHILSELKDHKHNNVVDHIEWFEECSLPSVSPLPESQVDWSSNTIEHETPILFHIVMELCSHGNLHSYINKNQPKELEIYEWIRHVCSGLDFLHTHGIIHKKLKLSDLVLSETSDVKISGLGVSLEKFNVDSPYGESAHLSPELVKGLKIEASSDLWSLGVVVFQLLNWSAEITSNLFYSQEKIEEALKGKDAKLGKIVIACLNVDPTKRPTAKEVLEMLN